MITKNVAYFTALSLFITFFTALGFHARTPYASFSALLKLIMKKRLSFIYKFMPCDGAVEKVLLTYEPLGSMGEECTLHDKRGKIN